MCETPDILMMCRHQKWTEYLHRITFSTKLDVFYINFAQWEVSSCTTTRTTTTTTTTTLLSDIFSIINYCCRSVPVVGSFKLTLRCTTTCRANFLLKLKFFKKKSFCPPTDIPVPPLRIEGDRRTCLTCIIVLLIQLPSGRFEMLLTITPVRGSAFFS